MRSPVIESKIRNNSVANLFRCLCHTQTVIPLSYAAQIPTTRDPDMATVRLSISRVDHQVGTTVWCARTFVGGCIYVYDCMYEEVLMYVCD